MKEELIFWGKISGSLHDSFLDPPLELFFAAFLNYLTEDGIYMFSLVGKYIAAANYAAANYFVANRAAANHALEN